MSLARPTSAWRAELRERVRRDQEIAERRLASVESPSWRARLDAVKAQMEDSSLKVELAEQEMRRAVASMREEQRVSGHHAGVRQRSLADMQELIHGLRQEQQMAKQALHTCQQSLRAARGVAVVHIFLGHHRYCLSRALRTWAAAGLSLDAAMYADECTRLHEAVRQERRQKEGLEAQLRGSGYELEERDMRSSALTERVGQLESALARRTAAMASEAEASRERTVGELKTEHKLQIASLQEEHEVAPPRAPARAFGAQSICRLVSAPLPSADASLLPLITPLRPLASPTRPPARQSRLGARPQSASAPPRAASARALPAHVPSAPANLASLSRANLASLSRDT